jgi:hypothetical protein
MEVMWSNPCESIPIGIKNLQSTVKQLITGLSK